MGVEGFLRQVKDALQEAHVRAFSGQTLAVDAFSWLHKAYALAAVATEKSDLQPLFTRKCTLRCYGCAFELATGKATDAYVHYMLRKVQLLRACGVGGVILVFDGQRLPLKVSAEERSWRRTQQLTNACAARVMQAATHEKRQSSKEENRRVAMQLLRDAKRLDGEARAAEVAKAYQHFQRVSRVARLPVAL